ncbi:hypothetical protein NDI89_19600 [Natrinema sp. S1CR25-10]|uniref:Uncharacterized protein n=2 Tax=Natrinema salsiterrestre TaxID=2950540 RepID=A0A9Q4L526_9EURY|nr:hypothetical protein [Natrinema salsiterrestre]
MLLPLGKAANTAKTGLRVCSGPPQPKSRRWRANNFDIGLITSTYIKIEHELNCMTEDGSNSEGLMKRQTTGEDRVRMVVRQLSEPRTANWIASEAGWSHEPTKRVLERLVDDGILHRDESGTHTTYYPDYRRQAMQEAMRLRDSGHTVEELTDRLAEMKAQIRDWGDEFNVESPNQLRGTLADETLDADEENRRREIACEWEHLQRRIKIVGFAIREWDFLAPTSESTEANS